jgi:hypothetical protein
MQQQFLHEKEVSELLSGGVNTVFLQHHDRGGGHDVAQSSLLKRLFWFAGNKGK